MVVQAAPNGTAAAQPEGGPRPLQAGQDASNAATISNFAGITLPKPLTAKGEIVIQLDTAGLDAFHGQLLSSLSKSELVSCKFEAGFT